MSACTNSTHCLCPRCQRRKYSSQRVCSNCLKPGHNRRNCTNQTPRVFDPAPLISLVRQYQEACVRWGESKDPADYLAVQRIQGELSAVQLGQGRGDELPRPIPGCKFVDVDGTCGHPRAVTPECHEGVPCPEKAAKEEEFRAGLPAEALRAIWVEWEEEPRDSLKGSDVAQRLFLFTASSFCAPGGAWVQLVTGCWQGNVVAFRPHGKTWAEAERMAAEKLGADDAKAGREQRSDQQLVRDLATVDKDGRQTIYTASAHAYQRAYTAALPRPGERE